MIYMDRQWHPVYSNIKTAVLFIIAMHNCHCKRKKRPLTGRGLKEKSYVRKGRHKGYVLPTGFTIFKRKLMRHVPGEFRSKLYKSAAKRRS